LGLRLGVGMVAAPRFNLVILRWATYSAKGPDDSND
jgi:hypothetical protein